MFSGTFDVSESPLGGYMRHVIVVPGHRVYMVDATGNLIATRGPPLSAGETLSQPKSRLARLVGVKRSGSYSSARGDQFFVSMGIADTPWRLVVVVPQAQLYISVNGASKWLAWVALAGLALAGLLINMIGLRLVHSRTRLATLNADLQRLARVDVLTGLSNRRDIEETLIAALSAARRHQSSLAILLIDIVDGEAEKWPANVLIDTTVEIDDPPPGAREGAIARTPQLCARWSGSSPVGSRFRIRAGLVADWLTPSYQSTVGGKIARLHTVWVPSDCDANGWPGAPMRLIETRDVVRFLPQPGDESGLVAGLLIELVVQSNEIAGPETA